MTRELSSPVLLIGFNRPDTFKVALNAIRTVQPKKLYIALDGARKGNAGDVAACGEVREIAGEIDWKCRVNYLIRDQNLGCKLGVTSAITWALQEEEYVIIIEDDVVPAPSFFTFADNMLHKYKLDNRIAMVSANNYTPLEQKDDYFFSAYGHIWGWATWKRVWDDFDVNVPDLNDALKHGLDKFDFINAEERKFMKKYFSFWRKKIVKNQENAWGPQFWFYRLHNGLLSIVPRVNLASNIGTVSSRTGSVAKTNENFFESFNNFEVKIEPEIVARDVEYDIFHFSEYIKSNEKIITRILDKITKLRRLFQLVLLFGDADKKVDI